ncbi:MAG: YdgA family protein [Chromatiales bacterium]|nr:YdgA family protein [Chromatiales bacterium]
MKKVLLGALVLVAATSLGLPGYLGSQVEQRYQAQIDELKKAGFTVLDHRYERGWFGAVAETRMGMPIPTEMEELVTEEVMNQLAITWQSDLSHGPWLSTPFSGLAEIDTKVVTGDDSPFVLDESANIHTLIAWDGSGEAQVDLPKLVFKVEEDEALIFNSLQGTTQFDSALNEIDSEGSMSSLQFVDGDKQGFTMQGIRIESSTRPGNSGLNLGNSAITADSLSLQLPTAGDIVLTKVGIDVSGSEQGEQVKAGVGYNFQQLDFGGQQLGPGELQITIDNLPASELLKMQQGMEEIRANPSVFEQQEMMMALLLSSGPEFLASDPKLSIDKLHLKTPEGEVNGDFSLQSVGLAWNDVSNPAAIVERLQGAAKFSLPRAYLDKILLNMMTDQLRMQELITMEQGGEAQDPAAIEEQAKMMANMQIEMMVGQGFLQQTDGLISSTAKLDGGKLTVNGNAIPLPIPGVQ